MDRVPGNLDELETGGCADGRNTSSTGPRVFMDPSIRLEGPNLLELEGFPLTLRTGDYQLGTIRW
jgi:hypothetical protein